MKLLEPIQVGKMTLKNELCFHLLQQGMKKEMDYWSKKFKFL